MTMDFAKLYIDGGWADPAGSQLIDVINPATETPIASVPRGTAADIDRAVRAAAAACPCWSTTPAADRQRYLQAIAAELRAQAPAVADTIVAELGMPVDATLAVQVMGAAEILENYADEIGTLTYDAIVIGAGIIGCAIALELGRAGRRVLCVDAGPAAGSGSTGASSAIVRFHYSDATAIAVAWDSYFDLIVWRDYLQLPAGETLASYVPTGALVLDAPGSRRQATLDQFRRIGIHCEQLTATDIRRRFPEMSTQSFWPPKTPDDPAFWDDGHGEIGGYLTPDAGYIDDPQLAARNIMSAAQHAGVTFLFGRLVRHVNTTRDQVAGVELDTGDTIHGPIVVNAGGPASDRLNQLAGVTGDMTVRGRPLRTETHEIPAPPGFRTGRGGVFVTDADLGVAFRPHGLDRLHISSLEPDCDPLEWAGDPWSYNSTPTQRACDRQTLRVARRLPALRIPPRPCGTGALYDVTPDWRPIFDCSALPGYYPTRPSMRSRSRSACPLWRAYSSIMCTSSSRSETGSPSESRPTKPRSWSRVNCSAKAISSRHAARASWTTAGSATASLKSASGSAAVW
jgi:sarcosine oxidase, subunit beta